jgi:hypothetical protein
MPLCSKFVRVYAFERIKAVSVKYSKTVALLLCTNYKENAVSKHFK